RRSNTQDTFESWLIIRRQKFRPSLNPGLVSLMFDCHSCVFFSLNALARPSFRHAKSALTMRLMHDEAWHMPSIVDTTIITHLQAKTCGSFLIAKM
ncbi:MAG: hypothetical protein Q8M07_04470, partial [Prosthecobacter sp.]|nr:hypothetical protein [Prosthecobacter sp.]